MGALFRIWTCDEDFFLNIPNNWLIGRINCGVFPVEISAHTVILCPYSMIFDLSTKNVIVKTFQRKLYLGLEYEKELGI